MLLRKLASSRVYLRLDKANGRDRPIFLGSVF